MNLIESRTIKIPKEVTVSLNGKVIEIKGEKGKLSKDFSQTTVSIRMERDEIKVVAALPRRKDAALVGTICSHIENMINGVTKGYTYKLKNSLRSLSNFSKD